MTFLRNKEKEFQLNIKKKKKATLDYSSVARISAMASFTVSIFGFIT